MLCIIYVIYIIFIYIKITNFNYSLSGACIFQTEYLWLPRNILLAGISNTFREFPSRVILIHNSLLWLCYSKRWEAQHCVFITSSVSGIFSLYSELTCIKTRKPDFNLIRKPFAPANCRIEGKAPMSSLIRSKNKSVVMVAPAMETA